MIEGSEVEPIPSKLADHFAKRLEGTSAQQVTHLMESSKWLSASLLVINSGAAVFTLQGVEKLGSPWLPIVLFGLGILLSLLNAVLIQEFVQSGLPSLEALIAFWRRAEIDGEFDRAELQSLKAGIAKVNRRSFLPPLVGWFSGLAFVTGGLVVSTDLVEQSRMARQATVHQPSVVTPPGANPREGQK
ncbi:hypothetical protein [Sphingomonas sp. S2M10]|uniref:hypothetical protein n=1 Tax=Sphingomonas sp. S2M10 TaxID=2705010 RepID=UPI001457841A|nr:hypothetical protein [Sphingomonas sp. S2M10]